MNGSRIVHSEIPANSPDTDKEHFVNPGLHRDCLGPRATQGEMGLHDLKNAI